MSHPQRARTRSVRLGWSPAGELIEVAVRRAHMDPCPVVVGVRVPDDVCPCRFEFGGGLVRVVSTSRHSLCSSSRMLTRIPVPLQNAAMASGLRVHRVVHAARWYWLITPPSTFRRRTGAAGGTEAGSSYSGAAGGGTDAAGGCCNARRRSAVPPADGSRHRSASGQCTQSARCVPPFATAVR